MARTGQREQAMTAGDAGNFTSPHSRWPQHGDGCATGRIILPPQVMGFLPRGRLFPCAGASWLSCGRRASQ
ncbi:hypothetical protein NJLHNGOC_09955 [Novacetimonas cocois]|uniref:Uncharacterized protein n=1 Tax=Novacetimonas cocois TaxID=1747507 RepID=A0A365YVK6_9PROT|nr:hypothetical protein NJLHNGOC_09955 [Novacetimonas cocois]